MLGDHYGRKRVFLAGLAIFALGSVGCALAPSAGALIASRAVQGIGGAAMLALTLAILTATFPLPGRTHPHPPHGVTPRQAAQRAR